MLAPRLHAGLLWAFGLLCTFAAPWGSAAEPASTAMASSEASPWGVPVARARLADARGGSFQTENHMDLNGITAGNSASHVRTGNNAIEAGAFDHMSGLPVVVQNSGANVLIQNAVIINLQMQ